MSQIRWYYERSVCDETSDLMFYFTGANAFVQASVCECEDDEGNDLTESLLNGDEIELSLDFISCDLYDSPNSVAIGDSPEEFGGLHFDEDKCKTVHEESVEFCDDLPDELWEKMEDDFCGTGLVRRLPPQNGKPGELRFEVDRDTATGIVAQLVNHRSLADFLTFQIFSQIAPNSFSLASLRLIGAEANQPGISTGNAEIRCLADRFEPPTISKTCLTDKEFVELLKNPYARISYRQLYGIIPCKSETMRKYLVNARLAEKGVRLTAQTFAASELVSDLVPYLQRLKPLGEKAYRLLGLFFNAGHISQYRID